MTLANNISECLYYYLPNDIQICRTKNKKILPLETIALKDDAELSEIGKLSLYFLLTVVDLRLKIYYPNISFAG